MGERQSDSRQYREALDRHLTADPRDTDRDEDEDAGYSIGYAEGFSKGYVQGMEDARQIIGGPVTWDAAK